MRKGFTLVELIATLVILSIIALIVTPNILVSIREYKQQIYDSNVQSINGAAKEWASDNIEELPETDTNSILVSLEELIDGAYLNEKVKDPINKGYFDDDDHFTFVIIDCYQIKDEVTGELINNKYQYNVYISIDDFIEKRAIEYAKSQNMTSGTIQYSDLTNSNYIKSTINNTKWYDLKHSESQLVIDSSDINDIVISYTDEEYSAVVNWK